MWIKTDRGKLINSEHISIIDIVTYRGGVIASVEAYILGSPETLYTGSHDACIDVLKRIQSHLAIKRNLDLSDVDKRREFAVEFREFSRDSVEVEIEPTRLVHPKDTRAKIKDYDGESHEAFKRDSVEIIDD